MDDSARLPCPFGWDYDTEGAFDTVIKQARCINYMV